MEEPVRLPRDDPPLHAVPVWILLPLGVLPMIVGVLALLAGINCDDGLGLAWCFGTMAFVLIWVWLLVARIGAHPFVATLLILVLGAVTTVLNFGVTLFAGCVIDPPHF